MRDALIATPEAAIRAVDAARFFQTERGFHGRFHCALQEQLDRAGLMTNGAILEMEYQKSTRHDLTQRPDIVFHIPAEHSGASVQANNFAVWALKRRASIMRTQLDFVRLHEMFRTLLYPLGFFVNIDATDPMRQHYTGAYRGRLAAVAAKLTGSARSLLDAARCAAITIHSSFCRRAVQLSGSVQRAHGKRSWTASFLDSQRLKRTRPLQNPDTT
ncbi:MAG: hypothetical protein ABW205_02840 [Burkholderiales bacterium]